MPPARYDIFLSYAREDAERARMLVEALSAEGWSVFWDRDSIPAGETFPSYLKQSLLSSACVLVLWSRSAVGSRWVEHEARFAHERGLLIPAFLETVAADTIPFGLEHVHGADLSNWPAERDTRCFRGLTEVIRARVGPGSGKRPPQGQWLPDRPAGSPEPAMALPTRWGSRPLRLALGATLVVGAVLVAWKVEVSRGGPPRKAPPIQASLGSGPPPKGDPSALPPAMAAAAPATKESTAKTPPAAADGQLDPDVVSKGVAARIGAVKGCYERALKDDPKLEGKILARWTITATGSVSEIAIDEDTVKSSAVAGCVRAVIARWHFPAPRGGAVEVSFPFVFRVGS
jgi:hypothetical protein